MPKKPNPAARGKNPHAVALGSLGGLARKASLSPEERTAIARAAGREGGKKSGEGRIANLTAERRREIASAAGKASAKARAKKRQTQKSKPKKAGS